MGALSKDGSTLNLFVYIHIYLYIFFVPFVCLPFAAIWAKCVLAFLLISTFFLFSEFIYRVAQENVVATVRMGVCVFALGAGGPPRKKNVIRVNPFRFIVVYGSGKVVTM